MTRKYFTLIVLLFISGIGWAQDVRFEASSDARQIVLGGFFEVQFTVHNASMTSFNPPSFKDFEVMSGPNENSRVFIENGKRTQSYGLSYSLQPKKIGKYIIPAATAVIEGKNYRTRPIQVEVLKGKNSSASTKQELDKELGEGVFVKAILNKEESKIGEQIILDYKLYTSRNIESYNVATESEYPGFYAHEVRRYNGRQIQEVVDGVQYTTKLIKKVALFPQQAGVFLIDPLQMNISIAIGGEQKRSIFSVPKVTTFQTTTDTIKVVVSSLPEPPPSFSGAVGKFEMRTTINRNKLSTDDAITMRMYIEGNGDIKQVQAPDLQISDKFEVYEPKTLEDNSFESNSELNGKKVFEYLILPKEVGTFIINSAFSYFDSDSLKYITLKSENFPISVTKGELNRTQVIANVNENIKKEDIRTIKTNVALSKNGQPFICSYLFWSLFVFPFLLLGGVIVKHQVEASKGNIDAAELKKRQAIKVAQKRLAQGKVFMEENKSKAYYDEVSRASFGYICDKLNIPYSELTKQNVHDKMQSLDVTANSIDKFMQIIKTCEMALFAGKDNAAAMNETYQNAIDVIAEIEEQITS